MSDQEKEQEMNKSFQELIQESADFDGIDRSVLPHLGLGASATSTPVSKDVLAKINALQKGKRFAGALSEFRAIEKNDESGDEEDDSQNQSLFNVMSGLNKTMKASQTMNKERRREEKFQGWDYSKFTPPKIEKFTAGEFKFFLAGLNDYMDHRALSDDMKVHVLKFKIGSFIGDMIRLIPNAKGMRTYGELCSAIIKHINPNMSKETIKLAFFEIQQEEDESNGAYVDKLMKYSEMIDFDLNEDAQRELIIIQNIQRNGNQELFRFAADMMADLPLVSFGDGVKLQQLRKRGINLDNNKSEALKKNRSVMQHEAYKTGERLADEHAFAVNPPFMSESERLKQENAELKRKLRESGNSRMEPYDRGQRSNYRDQRDSSSRYQGRSSSSQYAGSKYAGSKYAGSKRQCQTCNRQHSGLCFNLMRCDNCGIVGHPESRCREPKNQRKRERSQTPSREKKEQPKEKARCVSQLKEEVNNESEKNFVNDLYE